MGVLYRTRVVHLEKRIESASKGQILSVIQDPSQELRLSPLAISVEQDEHNPALFTITDRLPVLCGMETTTTFRCCSKKVDLENEQGTDNEVWAGLGTKLLCERRVEERDPPKGAESSQKEVWLREKVVLKAWFLLMPFISRTMIRTHIAAFDLIEARAAEQADDVDSQKSLS